MGIINDEGETIQVKVHEPWLCPDCGYRAIKSGGVAVFGIDPECDGTYCLRCYVRYMSKNVPRMVWVES